MTCWLKILAAFFYKIKHCAEKEDGNTDCINCQPSENCKKCLHMKKRDGGPTRLDMEEQLGENDVYS